MSNSMHPTINLRFCFCDQDENSECYEINLEIIGEGPLPLSGKEREDLIESLIRSWIQENVSYEWEEITSAEDEDTLAVKT